MANVSDKSILTAAGKALLAQLNAEEKALVIDKMIFANVPNRPEYPQPDDVVPADNVVHQSAVEQRGRLSEDSVIYSTTLASNEGPFEFNWTGAYCSEYGVLVTIDHHSLTPKTVDEPGVSGNTLVRSVVLEYKDIAEITNITVDASTWQYNATPRMKKMDNDVAQANIDQNGKDWFIEEGFLVTPQASAFSIKAGAGYVSGNRVALEFDRSIQVPNKPSFIYIDAHREGTPTGEQVTLFNFVVSAEEKDDYIDSSTGKDVPHFVCKIAQVLVDGSVSDLRPEGGMVSRKQLDQKQTRLTNTMISNVNFIEGEYDDFNSSTVVIDGEGGIIINDYPRNGVDSIYLISNPKSGVIQSINLDLMTVTLTDGDELLLKPKDKDNPLTVDVRLFGAVDRRTPGFAGFDSTMQIQAAIDYLRKQLPKANENFNNEFGHRGVLDLAHTQLNFSAPIEVQEDIVEGLYASGITVKNGRLQALPTFKPAIQVDKSDGTTKEISAAFIYGCKNYAVQSGKFVGYQGLKNISVHGGDFHVDYLLYTDVVTSSIFENISGANLKVGWGAKVCFLSSFKTWKLYNCNGAYNVVNTSKEDGYNGGNGLEGGGNNVFDWVITEDGSPEFDTIPRIYQRKLGEVKVDNFTSYNGLGDGIVVDDLSVSTGQKWCMWSNVEFGDLKRHPLILNATSYLMINGYQQVKCGQKLKEKGKPLNKISNSSHVIISNIQSDQFYDFSGDNWGELFEVDNSVGVKFSGGIMPSIPAENGVYDVIAFKNGCSWCSVSDIDFSIPSYDKKHRSPVSSDDTCSNISVNEIGAPLGAFTNPAPRLKGSGDYYDNVRTHDRKTPSSSPRRSLALSAKADMRTNSVMKTLTKTVNEASEDVFIIGFVDDVNHSCLVDVELSCAGDSKVSHRVISYRFYIYRGTNNQWLFERVEKAPQIDLNNQNYGFSNVSVNCVVAPYQATFSLSIEKTGLIQDNYINAVVDIKTSSLDDHYVDEV